MTHDTPKLSDEKVLQRAGTFIPPPTPHVRLRVLSGSIFPIRNGETSEFDSAQDKSIS